MKKTFKLSVLLLCATMLFSSCIGSFRLTNKLKDWNESIGDKWVNELVFLAMHIIPVYEVSIFVDAVVLKDVKNSVSDKKFNVTPPWNYINIDAFLEEN